MLRVKSVVKTILLFLIVFNPPVVKGFSFTICTAFFSLMLLVLNGNYRSRIINCLVIKKLFLILFVLLFMTSVFDVYNYTHHNIAINSYIDIIKSTFIDNFVLILNALLIIFVYGEEENSNNFFLYFVRIGVIQSVIGLLAFVLPSVHSILLNLMAENSSSEIIKNSIKVSNFRNYGFASQLYDNFGFAMSILAILSLVLALNEDKKYFVSFSLISITAIINARTSIILIGLGVVIILIKNEIIHISKIKLLVFIGIILCAFMIYYITNKSSKSGSSQWLISGIDEIMTLIIDGEATGYFGTLFYEFIFFPKELLQLIFGTGVSSLEYELSSDVGYINIIWTFGLIGLMLVIWFFAIVVRDYKINSKKQFAVLGNALWWMILVYFIKLSVFGYGQASLIIFALMLFPSMYCDDIFIYEGGFIDE